MVGSPSVTLNIIDPTGAATGVGLPFAMPLVQGVLLRRYKRFLADVQLVDGETVVAHCPNSGSMLSVADPGSEVWLSPANAPGRTLKYTWELIRVGEALVGINTGRPNAMAAAAIGAQAIPELAGYTNIRREVRYGTNSRIDLLLQAENRPTCFVEVKNVTLRRGSGGAPAEFPDCVTARGLKHLAELGHVVAAGDRAVMLFVVQRRDTDRLRFAEDIDPAYAIGVATAAAAGVEMLCYRWVMDTAGGRLDRALPIEMPIATGAALPRRASLVRPKSVKPTSELPGDIE